MLNIFDKSDDQYFEWMSLHPNDYIVNTHRSVNSREFTLHKASCSHIASIAGLLPGAFTEREYIKVVSNELSELYEWFISNRPKFSGQFVNCKTCNPVQDRFLVNPENLFPDLVDNEKDLFEGVRMQVIVNRYERNAIARAKCLTHYGYTCQACEINFEEKYGDIGKGFIHVHHIKALHEIDSKYKVDPINDLIPLCPNCHAMIHQRKSPCYTVGELKQMIK